MANVTRAKVRSISKIRDEEKNHVDPTTKPSVLTGDWSKTQDVIREWLRRYQGTNNAPLAYLIRDYINPPPEADDPSTGYDIVED